MAVAAVGERWREGGRGQERASGLVCAEIMIYSEEVLLISCLRRCERRAKRKNSSPLLERGTLRLMNKKKPLPNRIKTLKLMRSTQKLPPPPTGGIKCPPRTPLKSSATARQILGLPRARWRRWRGTDMLMALRLVKGSSEEIWPICRTQFGGPRWHLAGSR